MAATSILINVGAKTADAVRDLGKVDRALKDQSDATKKASGSWKKMAGAVAGVVTAAAVGDYLMDAAKAASADAAETEKLNTVITNNTDATKKQVDAASSWIDQMEIATTVSDSDLRVALGKLTVQTGDLGEAQEATATAVDLAAGKNISLSSATKIVEKALAGQTDTLKKQHPEWDKNKDGILSSTEAMDGLGDSYGGAAEAAADPWEQIQTIFGQLQEQVGSFVLPLLDKVKDWLNNPGNVEQLQTTLGDIADTAKDMGERIAGAIGWMIDNQGAVKAVAGVLGALAAAMIVVSVAQSIWATVTAVWTAVTAVATAVGGAFAAVVAVITSPVFLIIAAIVALIAIVVLLWQNWDTVTAALAKAWDWLVGVLSAAFDAIKRNIKTIVTVIISILVPFIGIGLLVVKNWDKIKAALAKIWDGIKTTAANAFTALKTKVKEIWDGIKTAVTDAIAALVEFVTGMPGKILDAIGNLGKLLYDKGKDLITGLIDGIKKKDLAGYVGGLPGKILDAIGNLGSLLYSKGQDLIQGLINGIKSVIGGIGNLIKGAIPDWVPGFNSATLPPSAAAFTAAPTKTAPKPKAADQTVIVTEEQIARAIQRLLLKSDARNGRLVMVG